MPLQAAVPLIAVLQLYISMTGPRGSPEAQHAKLSRAASQFLDYGRCTRCLDHTNMTCVPSNQMAGSLSSRMGTRALQSLRTPSSTRAELSRQHTVCQCTSDMGYASSCIINVQKSSIPRCCDTVAVPFSGDWLRLASG